MRPRGESARLLQERCREAVAAPRDHRSFSLERSSRPVGKRFVHWWSLPFRRDYSHGGRFGGGPTGLGRGACTPILDAFSGRRTNFSGKCAGRFKIPLARIPGIPYSAEIVQYDDPHDRARAWCEAQGRLLVIADATCDRLKETGHSRHPRLGKATSKG